MIMTASIKPQLLEAILKDDTALLEATGWQPVADYLRKATKQKWQTADLEPFADLWHDKTPDAIINATRECMRAGASNGWRPIASQLAPYFATKQTKKNATMPWQELAALATVTKLRAAGQQVCHCTPSTTALHLTTGLLRCPNCNGLDDGQVDDALAVAA